LESNLRIVDNLYIQYIAIKTFSHRMLFAFMFKKVDGEKTTKLLNLNEGNNQLAYHIIECFLIRFPINTFSDF